MYASVYTLREAIALRFPVWDLYITNWGNTNASADINQNTFPNSGNTSQFPLINGRSGLDAVSGIAIGPLSTHDAVFVELAQTLNTGQPAGEFMLSCEQPLFFPIGGPWSLASGLATPPTYFMSNTVSPYHFPAYQRTYNDLKTIDGTIDPFDNNMAEVGGQRPFRDTLLHLQVFIDSVPSIGRTLGGQMSASMLKTKRFPYMDTSRLSFTGANAEAIGCVWPMFGRKRARVMYRKASGAGTPSVRTTGAVPFFTGTSVGSSSSHMEFQMTGSAETIADTSTAVIHNFDNLNVDFLMARFTTSDTAIVDVHVEAYD